MSDLRIRITFETGNDAFVEGWDAAVEDVLDQLRAILTTVRGELAGEDEAGARLRYTRPLLDLNGNTMGGVAVDVAPA